MSLTIANCKEPIITQHDRWASMADNAVGVLDPVTQQQNRVNRGG